MTGQDTDLSFVISKVKLHGMGVIGTAEVVRVPAWKDGCVEVVGSCFVFFCFFLWYIPKPYVKQCHHLARPLVVTNCLCRMMGKLERDGFREAGQILYKLLPPWRH